MQARHAGESSSPRLNSHLNLACARLHEDIERYIALPEWEATERRRLETEGPRRRFCSSSPTSVTDDATQGHGQSSSMRFSPSGHSVSPDGLLHRAQVSALTRLRDASYIGKNVWQDFPGQGADGGA